MFNALPSEQVPSEHFELAVANALVVSFFAFLALCKTVTYFGYSSAQETSNRSCIHGLVLPDELTEQCSGSAKQLAHFGEWSHDMAFPCTVCIVCAIAGALTTFSVNSTIKARIKELQWNRRSLQRRALFLFNVKPCFKLYSPFLPWNVFCVEIVLNWKNYCN